MAKSLGDRVVGGLMQMEAAKDRAIQKTYSGAKRAGRAADKFIGEHLSGMAGKTKYENKDIKTAAPNEGNIPSYKKGGIVKKTGLALVHKGERVIPKGGRKKK